MGRAVPQEKTIEEVRNAAQLDGLTGDTVLKRLYAYWCERRGAKRYPSRADIDPVDFGFALGLVSLIEVQGPPLRFRYRLVSTKLTEHLGYEMTGKFVDEIPPSETRAYTEASYKEALARRTPVFVHDTVLLDGWLWTHETLVLPLSADDATINMLMIYRTTDRPKWADASKPMPASGGGHLRTGPGA